MVLINKILLFLLLLPGIAFGQQQAATGDHNAAGCADCSGTASFIWECNSATVGDTGYSPCGCSDGDDVGIPYNDATISSGAAVLNDTSTDGLDRYVFDNGSDVLSDDTVGTVFIGLKVTTWINTVNLFHINGDTNNNVRIYLNSSNDVFGLHIGNGDQDIVALLGSNVSTGVNYVIRYRWRTTGDADHEITLYPADMSSTTETNNDADNLTAFTTQADAGDFHVGNYGTTTGSNFKIGFIHMYKEYRDTDPNFDSGWVTGM